MKTIQEEAAEAVGKTIASVTQTEMTGKDIHYGDDVNWIDTTILFTDGSVWTIFGTPDEMDGDTIKEAEPSDD